MACYTKCDARCQYETVGHGEDAKRRLIAFEGGALVAHTGFEPFVVRGVSLMDSAIYGAQRRRMCPKCARGR
jgi:hypothetical protein